MTINTEIDTEIFAAVVAESIAKAAAAPKDAERWVNAIAKATFEIENNPNMIWQPDSRSLYILADRTNKVYDANGVCQCIAYYNGFPCYHRAAARIIALYLERTH